jgi:hypothetical protein
MPRTPTYQPSLFMSPTVLGRGAYRRPKDRYSLAYCRFLAMPHRIRDRRLAETMYRQKYRCYECNKVLNPRWTQLHHPNGYGQLNYEEASDLAAVHGLCHRRIHERMALTQTRDRMSAGCGCNAA